jgi:hypothetical protein
MGHRTTTHKRRRDDGEDREIGRVKIIRRQRRSFNCISATAAGQWRIAAARHGVGATRCKAGEGSAQRAPRRRKNPL